MNFEKLATIYAEDYLDIVVTIPKSEYNNDNLESIDTAKNNLIQFWKFSKSPKKTNIGKRIYFIKNNKIESSGKIIKIERNKEEKCQTTGRIWVGDIFYFDDIKDENLDIATKGFQGFRYKWW